MISRARALLTGLAALAVIAALVVGLPIVLYRFGGSPLPRHIAGWHHITAVLTSTDQGTVLLSAVRDCSWLAWLLFGIALAAEAQAALRGHAAPRLWLGGMQGGAARLVALAALMFAAPPALTLTANAATAAPAHAPVSVPATLLDAPTALRVVTVRPGDCLWTIAQHYLGAGDRYPEIASMNYGRDMGHGHVFSNPSLIMPGWQLLVPDTGASANPTTPAEHSRAGAAPAGTGTTHQLGHPSSHRHYRRRHASASDRAPGGPAFLASNIHALSTRSEEDTLVQAK